MNVQTLEDRTLLTGNVDVQLAGRDVTLTGDAGDNEIVIEQMNNWVIVRGINGTTVGGLSEYLVSGLPFLQDDVHIHLGDGNDSVFIADGIVVGDELLIDTGAGNDNVVFSGVMIHDDLIVDTGDGDDTILIRNTDVGDDQGIFAGAGNNNVSVVNTRIADDLVVHTGNGNDDVAILGTTSGDRNELNTFGGNDMNAVLGANDGRFLPGEDLLGGVVDPDAMDDAYEALGNTLVVNAAEGLAANDFRSAVLGTTSVNLESTNQLGTVVVAADGSFTYTPPTPDFVGTDTFTYRLSNSFGGFDIATVTISRPEHTLTIDDLTTSADVEQSNEILVTENEQFTITGMTNPFAVVDVDRDGDGEFNDGTVEADANGVFTVIVTLLHDDMNMGANTLEVRSTIGLDRSRMETVNVHFAVGTVTRFQSSQGTFDVELLDEDAPTTVANFRNYFDRYTNSIVHRSLDQDFVIQGGGFVFDDSMSPEVTPIMTDAAIQNEFDLADNSNVVGTLSMALGAGINTGTSQWFFNTVDNSGSLDAAKHTVFGRVIGTGMDVVDAIEALTSTNLNGVFPETALSTTPLDGYTPGTEAIAGTVSVAAGTNTVTGVGTTFTDLQASIGNTPGSTIVIAGETFVVGQIVNDTELTLHNPDSASSALNHMAGAMDATATVNAVPDETNFVVFQSIDELFGP